MENNFICKAFPHDGDITHYAQVSEMYIIIFYLKKLN